MTAESVCVSVSPTPPCYGLGAPNMLLFSYKWEVGLAHSRHGVYSHQDNRLAAAGLEFDLHTWDQSAAVMVDRKNLWLHFLDSYGLHYVLFQGVVPEAETCDVQWVGRTSRKAHAGLKFTAAEGHMEGPLIQERNPFIFMRDCAWICKQRILENNYLDFIIEFLIELIL